MPGYMCGRQRQLCGVGLLHLYIGSGNSNSLSGLVSKSEQFDLLSHVTCLINYVRSIKVLLQVCVAAETLLSILKAYTFGICLYIFLPLFCHMCAL